MTAPVKVLIAYDGTESAQRAVKYASKVLAQGRETEAVVVTAWESTIHQAARLSAMSGVAGAGAAETALTRETDVVHTEAKQTNAEGVELARAAGFTARGELVEVATTVWTAIIGASDAENVDVIVTGSRGTTGLKALWHSSVSEHVLRGCKRPVMIVPSGVPEL
ncbi:UspA domain protein OS=Tsukamurella paurometabola (strain ATCC 8368 / DSM / CCUG 35730 / CIP 100753 / JCM 10117 / KCTC 9821 / NBRC 16120 / NCIMB 702349/ NCTC 13040) OX=521096 GN=Tpau_0420 PE=3 SV=1 [Tsukamurella paurometabola]|uniref:UspA domain protein n=1 Tax=Tsukamurella paurometabola (strain ATCC 8368 / DSM 20162 / CCUG 35730 / CIP 100753 / JCM 10117 / KCTC 9821 / NBRC 16120 / NCIMB 702349 / NCTC 13040) TaxID=521096 RepID=D5URK8_TSUPD|nr:universal stress protein [Tsukamurella paurometabola]ADG77061.1 UspA domain protein [Tsukamurella paurometabola DSM 20162]SUP42639.1 Universal stress protein family [Tsukamurella paurometabola]